MRHLLILIAVVMLPTSALAHVGHLGEVAGHGHWLGAAAIGAAIAIGLLAASKDRKKQDAEAQGDEAEAELDDTQEA